MENIRLPSTTILTHKVNFTKDFGHKSVRITTDSNLKLSKLRFEHAAVIKLPDVPFDFKWTDVRNVEEVGVDEVLNYGDTCTDTAGTPYYKAVIDGEVVYVLRRKTMNLSDCSELSSEYGYFKSGKFIRVPRSELSHLKTA